MLVFAPGKMTESGAGTPQIMGRWPLYAGLPFMGGLKPSIASAIGSTIASVNPLASTVAYVFLHVSAVIQ